MTLLKKLRRINKRVKEDNDITKLNMYELMSITIEIGELKTKIIKNLNSGKCSNEEYVEELCKIYNEIINQYFSYNSFRLESHVVSYDSKVYKLYHIIQMQVYRWQYHYEEEMKANNKKHFLCYLASVGFEVEKTIYLRNQGEIVEKKYDIKKYEKLKEMYNEYLINNYMSNEIEFVRAVLKLIEKEYKNT